VRKNRPDDDHLVVIKKHPVNFHRHIHRKQPPGQFADLLGIQRSDPFQRRRIVPGMIEETDGPIFFPAFLLGDFQPSTNGRFTHRLMRSQRNQHVAGFGDLPDLFVNGFE
jgi:hypothetical protein